MRIDPKCRDQKCIFAFLFLQVEERFVVINILMLDKL